MVRTRSAVHPGRGEPAAPQPVSTSRARRQHLGRITGASSQRHVAFLSPGRAQTGPVPEESIPVASGHATVHSASRRRRLARPRSDADGGAAALASPPRIGGAVPMEVPSQTRVDVPQDPLSHDASSSSNVSLSAIGSPPAGLQGKGRGALRGGNAASAPALLPVEDSVAGRYDQDLSSHSNGSAHSAARPMKRQRKTDGGVASCKHIAALPRDVLLHVLWFVQGRDLAAVSRTSRLMREAAKASIKQRTLELSYVDEFEYGLWSRTSRPLNIEDSEANISKFFRELGHRVELLQDIKLRNLLWSSPEDRAHHSLRSFLSKLLRSARSLKSLNLSVSDLQELVQPKKLSIVEIIGFLSDLHLLEHLNMSHWANICAPLRESGMIRAQLMPNLVTLVLKGVVLDDGDAMVLLGPSVQNLRALDISETMVSGRIFSMLPEKLEYLDVSHTLVPVRTHSVYSELHEDGKAALRAALANMREFRCIGADDAVAELSRAGGNRRDSVSLPSLPSADDMSALTWFVANMTSLEKLALVYTMSETDIADRLPQRSVSFRGLESLRRVDLSPEMSRMARFDHIPALLDDLFVYGNAPGSYVSLLCVPGRVRRMTVDGCPFFGADAAMLRCSENLEVLTCRLSAPRVPQGNRAGLLTENCVCSAVDALARFACTAPKLQCLKLYRFTDSALPLSSDESFGESANRADRGSVGGRAPAIGFAHDRASSSEPARQMQWRFPPFLTAAHLAFGSPEFALHPPSLDIPAAPAGALHGGLAYPTQPPLALFDRGPMGPMYYGGYGMGGSAVRPDPLFAIPVFGSPVPIGNGMSAAQPQMPQRDWFLWSEDAAPVFASPPAAQRPSTSVPSEGPPHFWASAVGVPDGRSVVPWQHSQPHADSPVLAAETSMEQDLPGHVSLQTPRRDGAGRKSSDVLCILQSLRDECELLRRRIIRRQPNCRIEIVEDDNPDLIPEMRDLWANRYDWTPSSVE